MPLKLNAYDGDGGSRSGKQITVGLHDPDSGAPIEGVSVVVNLMTRADVRAIFATHTRMVSDPKTRAMVKQIDEQAANDEMVTLLISSWSGVVGADDRPLPCTDETKLELPDPYKIQLIQQATGAEVSDAASFRASQDVPRVVAG